jgi:hypothetical protein
MELEGPVPCSQESPTGPYPEPDKSSQLRYIIFKIHFNVIFLSKPMSPKLSLPFR